MMLHAVGLGFLEPSSGKQLEFEAPPPEDYVASRGGFS
jgi:23S rRNA-/tRNA-specific pseudouridylate synthase